MQKIVPFLWFDSNAEEAANFYVSVFKNGKITDIRRYGPDSPGPEGSVMSVSFELNSEEFIGLNGGPLFHFNESVSFFVNCDSQDEVDDLWAKLTADGGQESQCGWLKDKFGLSWQIVPTEMASILGDPDPTKANRAMQAMLKMKKIDLQALRDA
ncbi:MAG TPA: VOC family protein [Candidatus Saccharimonas sp.]|nr:VOC family protein [Candidatus Saccharimonas sp.]